jgi:hypothetical protein
MAFGQTAYTTPVGYVTNSLAVGLNALGLGLQNSKVASGNFETVAGTSLTDSGVTYTPLVGRTYILEITSGNLTGVIQEVLADSISGNTIKTPSDLQALGLTTADKYNLRLAATLEDIFTTTPLASGGVLVGALSFGTADIVWVPTGTPGSFDKYFLKTGTGAGFKRITGTASTNWVDAPLIPIIYADGFFVQKKTAAVASLIVSGEVKKVGTNSVLKQGLNLFAPVAPVGLTLKTAGFEDDITASLTVGNADLIWLQNPVTLAYTKYMRHTGNGGSWRLATGTNGVALAPEVDPPIQGAFYIQRKLAAIVNLDLNVPVSYNNL